MHSIDTEEEEEERSTPDPQPIEFDNGLKLDLSSIDDDSYHRSTRRPSIDADFEATRESNSRLGDWQTNFTLIESKVGATLSRRTRHCLITEKEKNLLVFYLVLSSCLSLAASDFVPLRRRNRA